MREAREARERRAIAERLSAAPHAGDFSPEQLYGAAGVIQQANFIAEDLELDQTPEALALSEASALAAFVQAGDVQRNPQSTVLEANAAAVGVTRVLAGDETAAQIAVALQQMPTDEQIPIIVTASRQARASGGRSVASGLVRDVYEILQGVGRTGAAIDQAIQSNPLARFGLLALDIASGPVAFAASSFIMASPLGNIINTGVNRATDWMVGQLRRAGMQDPQGLFYAASGAVLVGGLVLGARRGFQLFQRAMRRLDDTLDGLNFRRIGAGFLDVPGAK